VSKKLKQSELIVFSLLFAGASVTTAFAQSVPKNTTEGGLQVQSLIVSSVDLTVPTDSESARIHMMPVQGTRMKQQWPAASDTEAEESATAMSSAADIVATGIRFYPADVGNPSNNVTIATARNHDIYLNALPNVWGNPAEFLEDLSKSDFIHVTDQYVNATADNRYPVGYGAFVIYPNAPHTLAPNDIFAILHVAAGTFGTGYEDVYHVFVPPGIDVCTVPGAVCYSPDNPATFAFCAYHGAVTFPDIGHVIYSVEPYQNVQGCAINGTLPNGVLIDSTASALSHELFELITDPDLNAWWDRVDLDLHGAEIADVCQRASFSYDTPLLNGRLYEIQPEYSNAVHACVFSLTSP
jgi:hypothetical protein